jgi:hypothetical protein
MPSSIDPWGTKLMLKYCAAGRMRREKPGTDQSAFGSLA